MQVQHGFHEHLHGHWLRALREGRLVAQRHGEEGAVAAVSRGFAPHAAHLFEGGEAVRQEARPEGREIPAHGVFEAPGVARYGAAHHELG